MSTRTTRRYLKHSERYEIAIAEGLVVLRARWDRTALQFTVPSDPPLHIPLTDVHAVAGVQTRGHQWTPNWVPIDRCYLQKRVRSQRAPLSAVTSAF